MDGAEWLYPFVDHHRPDAVRISNFPCRATGMRGAGSVGRGDSSDAHMARRPVAHYEPWRPGHRAGRDSCAAGRVCAVASGGRDDARVLAYLTTRWEQSQYAAFRALGYPMGSGIVAR